MADPDEEFAHWWIKWVGRHEDVLTLLRLPGSTGHIGRVRAAAQEAWIAGREVQALVQHDSDGLERDGLMSLADRCRLVIEDIPDGDRCALGGDSSGGRVRASRTCEGVVVFYAEADGWDEMARKLNDMEKRGDL